MFKSQIVGLALNHQKWSEIGPEWSPGPENRPPGMPRPFSRLWDQSRVPKSGTKVKKWLVWGLALGSFALSSTWHRFCVFLLLLAQHLATLLALPLWPGLRSHAPLLVAY